MTAREKILALIDKELDPLLDYWPVSIADGLDAILEAAVAEEREACANVAMEHPFRGSRDIADAIRARG